ncbi:hypothetical protein U6A24_16590 [Aquimarina gracilis]|uniref:Uncharacterized protein n=1 Tax=Aquimarina gracilis TaxID=874422 RepID=A0ABU5ZYX0_9FLAO|nr:hypothetical protein [Aquimarina gracilis]MEB3347093.1 hypothetical protein [Aquimarina gracilis]
MILVFKTSVNDIEDVKVLKNQLNNFSSLIKWNFDLEDIDKVLRIESIKDISHEIIKLLQNNGFKCEDMDSGIIFEDE